MGDYYILLRGHTKIKPLKFLSIFFIAIIFFNVNWSRAQSLKTEISNRTSNKTYSLADLAVHDFKQKDQSNFINWSIFYNKYKNGMSILQKDIITHPDLYPMQNLEDKNKKEPDNFRRWEYQMRKMKAEIVSPQKNLLEVNFVSKKRITFCSDQSFKLDIKIKNISRTNLPMFYFFVKLPPGIILNQKEMELPHNVSFIKNGATFIFNKGLDRGISTTIQLTYFIGCDGHGGSPVLKGKSEIKSNLNWKLVLIGYILDYQNKKLYKVTDFGKSPKTIILTKI